MREEHEVEWSVIEPYFDAVRDAFAAFEPNRFSGPLAQLKRTKLVLDPKMHDTPRHFMACREDGLAIHVAPQIVHAQPPTTVVAILAHEFGHAADFAYPGHWVHRHQGGKARWLDDLTTHEAKRWWKIWLTRRPEEVEWAADAVAETVTGKVIGYCGDLNLQCLEGGVARPAELR